jgi:protocatechuate 3,4-dioxygenase, beta subunit
MPEPRKTQSPRDWSSQPPYLYPDYRSTVLRAPKNPLIVIPETLSELTGPVFGHNAIGPLDADLTKNAAKGGGEATGERVIVTGRVMDEAGRPVANQLVEIWQANSAGRYIHKNDQHPAPLDPNFLGAGRCVTDEHGRYRFLSIKPGPYPWKNHHNAWRPAHIHFSLFGPTIASRLVTQMYFPGDPLFPFDPIFNGAPAEARDRMISRFSLDITEPEWATGYEFDIYLRGPKATPMETRD